jgi:hypothetical protein
MGLHEDERQQPVNYLLLPSMQTRGQEMDTPRPAGLPAPVGIVAGHSHPPAKAVKVYTWTCQYCGQPFETQYYGQRYCNRTHREYAYRERRKSR